MRSDLAPRITRSSIWPFFEASEAKEGGVVCPESVLLWKASKVAKADDASSAHHMEEPVPEPEAEDYEECRSAGRKHVARRNAKNDLHGLTLEGTAISAGASFITAC